MTKNSSSKAVEVKGETKKLKRELTLLPLFGIIYFTVCGGTFGSEGLIGNSGPGLALILFIVTPFVFSIPNMLMVREMTSMMPVEGGYYHWIKQAFGPFTGFMAGWMNWVVSWVDVSIYPVLAAYYIGYFIPQLREGITIGSVELPDWFLQWVIALILIWGITFLNIRGARLAALTTNWLGIVMMVPLILMSGFGIYSWIQSGASITSLPLLPSEDTSLITALSTGLYIVMWNYMGWELPTAAGDEIVNPKKTYPLAMTLVLIAAIGTYMIPTLAGLYGGAGEDGRYLLWGQEAGEEGIGATLMEYGVTDQQLQDWNVDPTSSVGWELPDIAHAIGDKVTGVANSPLAIFLGTSVMLAAVLSMIGLFIGNGLGGTRVPFAMAEDGMMPKWMVKVHPKFGTPWVAIIFCGIIFSIFSLQAFSFLVVVDVFLNMSVLMMELLALWKLRVSRPELPRQKVPGGIVGLLYVTLAPAAIIGLAIYSQLMEEGLKSLGLAFIAIVIGAALYFPIKKYIKPGIPDVNPFVLEEE
jgi:amino acid transporter